MDATGMDSPGMDATGIEANGYRLGNPVDDYKIDFTKPIGNGLDGIVYPGTRKTNGRKVVVKLIHYNDEDAAKQSKEVLMHRECAKDNPFVVELIDAYYCLFPYKNDEYDLCPTCILVLEQLDESLHTLVCKPDDYPVEQIMTIILQIAQGLANIHSKSLYHGDIKLENVMIKDSGDVKIIDFGFCGSLFQNLWRRHTPLYCSPEIAHRNLHTHMSASLHKYNEQKADMWSLGVIMYTLLFKSVPFTSNSGKYKSSADVYSLYFKIEKGVFTRPPKYDQTPEPIRQLLESLLNIDPLERKSADETVEIILELFQTKEALSK
jgi:serine/threonine protein kinase